MKSNIINVILHNDREAMVNMTDFLYAMRVTVDGTDQQVTRIVFKDATQVDVQQKVHELYEMLPSP